jgi:hypothetical protein
MRQQRGEQRDDGLAAAHVALQQAVHPPVAGHVGHDLADDARLRSRELEGSVAGVRRELPPVPERDAVLASTRDRVARRRRICTNSSSSIREPRTALLRLLQRRRRRCTIRSASAAVARPPREQLRRQRLADRAAAAARGWFVLSSGWCLKVSPSVAGYTASTRPPANVPSSSPRFTYSRGCICRP